jgi:protein-S-isoprenylcysteine O-methyltransferase Ste14
MLTDDCRMIYWAYLAFEIRALLFSAGLSSTRWPVPARVYPHAHLPARMACSLVLLMAGTTLRASAQRELGRFFSWEVRMQAQHQLITSGPYKLIRHPAYTANLVNFVALCNLLPARGSYFAEVVLQNESVWRLFWAATAYLGVLLCVVALRVKDEDKMLQREFRDEWDNWAAKTRYRMVPWLF